MLLNFIIKVAKEFCQPELIKIESLACILGDGRGCNGENYYEMIRFLMTLPRESVVWLMNFMLWSSMQ